MAEEFDIEAMLEAPYKKEVCAENYFFYLDYLRTSCKENTSGNTEYCS